MNTPLSDLLAHPALWRASRFADASACARQGAVAGIPSGFPRLDRELPEHGWPAEGLTELLLPRTGQGEMPLLVPGIAHLGSQGRRIAWINPPCLPYAPALAAAGIDLSKMLLVHAKAINEALWAMEQCLASGTCSAVLGWMGKITPLQVRRLHLAASRGQCFGVLLRGQQQAQQASPAPLRLELGLLSSQQGGMVRADVRVIKRRGRWPSEWITLHWPSPVVPCLATTRPTTSAVTALTPSVAASASTQDSLATTAVRYPHRHPAPPVGARHDG
jgi:cell division inhibitor SulA